MAFEEPGCHLRLPVSFRMGKQKFSSCIYQFASDKAKSCRSKTKADSGQAGAGVSLKKVLNHLKMTFILKGILSQNDRKKLTWFIIADLLVHSVLSDSCIVIACRLYRRQMKLTAAFAIVQKELLTQRTGSEIQQNTQCRQVLMSVQHQVPLIHLVAFLTCLYLIQHDYITLESPMSKAKSSIPSFFLSEPGRMWMSVMGRQSRSSLLVLPDDDDFHWQKYGTVNK